MQVKWWLAVAALSSAVYAGSEAQADLFERFRSRPEEKTARSVDEPHPSSFTVSDEDEIGKIVTPVAYQPLPAPAPKDRLVPIPESQPIGPETGRAYYPPPSYPADGGPVVGGPPVGGPIVGNPVGPGVPFGPDAALGGYPLFERVEYEDLDHIHPCAKPTVVQVLDPCQVKRGGLLGLCHRVESCEPCGPRCVYVEICVPPGCPKVKVSRKRRKVKYDYGDYKVEVESKDGYVEVDYDD